MAMAIFLNQRWLDYTGMTADQAVGWGWGEAIHPDDRKGVIEYWQSCLASGVPGETEARMRRFDGAYRWFLFRASPLRDESGTVVKWYGINIDIDDRRRGEEALRASERNLNQILNAIPHRCRCDARRWNAIVREPRGHGLRSVVTLEETAERRLSALVPSTLRIWKGYAKRVG